jgi:uncharacterized membrane protein YqiK
MQFDGLIQWALVVGVALTALIAVFLVLARLYRRASKELSFVRTGAGGQKVVVNGGALVVPILHEVIPVNMNTLKLDVKRAEGQALITRDRMRVDVQAEFFVRVQPTEESIANAAQTLGRKTLEPPLLKELVEGKFVDALRSVAAEMEMEELHEQRSLFVQKVQQAVSEDLLKNGLELETVSLTGLDQTGKEFFNPDNAFDAEGLTKLTEAIELRRKNRNEIEQQTEVEVQKKTSKRCSSASRSAAKKNMRGWSSIAKSRFDALHSKPRLRANRPKNGRAPSKRKSPRSSKSSSQKSPRSARSKNSALRWISS